MFDSTILDVAIGLGFIFLLVSLLVTAVSEMLSGWLKWRSTFLWDGLAHLLQSADARNALYTHPLIKGLARVDLTTPDWNNGRNGPSYIPSRTFALALIDVLRRPHQVADAVERRLRAAVDSTTDPARAVAAVADIIDQVMASGAPDALKQDLHALRTRLLTPVSTDRINAVKAQVMSIVDRLSAADREAGASSREWVERQADQARTFLDLRTTLAQAIDRIPFAGSSSPPEQLRAALKTFAGGLEGDPAAALRDVQAFVNGAAQRWLRDANASMHATVDALQPLLHDAANDVERFRENVEVWFNNGMDRVSGWYKRHIAVVHGVIAMILAVAMNIDALQITRTLWREPTLRQSLLANATTFVNDSEADVFDPNPESVLDGTDQRLRITADKVRLFPNDVAKFTITPDTAGKPVNLTVVRQAPNVLLSPKAGDFSVDPFSLVSGNQSAEFYVKALPISSTASVRIKVATEDGREASPQLVVTPQGDFRFAAMREQIGTLGLPIGWACPQEAKLTAEPTSIGGPFWCSSPPGRSGHRWLSVSWWATWMVEILAMMLGWMITAAAASVGAPFWFDLLKRFISIRAGGKAPEERPHSPKEVPIPLEPGQRPREADLLSALSR